MDLLIEKGPLYSDFHQKSVCFYTHLIGIPFLFLSAMIFLNFFHLIIPGLVDTTLAELGTIILAIYYIRVHWQLGLIILPFLGLILWISRLIGYHGPSRFALWSLFIAFMFGLVSLLVGYFLTSTRLSVSSFRRLILAPLYLTAELCYRLGFLMKLNERLHGKEPEALMNDHPDDLL